MDGKDLIYGMGFVDEKFVEEAEYATQLRRTSFPWKYYFAAACFVCVISVAMLIPNIYDNPNNPVATQNYSVGEPNNEKMYHHPTGQEHTGERGLRDAVFF